MPVWKYKCNRCGWEGERLVKASDRDSQVCTSHYMSKDGRRIDPCLKHLQREEIALTSKMRINWQYIKE